MTARNDSWPLAGRVVGDYDTPSHLIGLYGSWKFLTRRAARS